MSRADGFDDEEYSLDITEPTVVTVGTFDGLHRGHQAILDRVTAESRRLGCEPIVITFHPHPRIVVSPENIPLLLTTREEKELLIPQFFEGRTVVLEFDDELRQLTADEFVKGILLDHFKARKVIVGYDHVFGRGRGGTIEKLNQLAAELGFEVEVVGLVTHNGEAVSSSRIRDLIAGNAFTKALDLLGHPFPILGTVERGLGLGRKLGYPTANVRYSVRKLLPAEGVYACTVTVDNDVHLGMMFIGRNHFNPQNRVTVEANLFDFDADIYDREIVVYPTRFVRENRRFPSTTELTRQIAHDKEMIQRIQKQENFNAHEQHRQSSHH